MPNNDNEEESDDEEVSDDNITVSQNLNNKSATSNPVHIPNNEEESDDDEEEDDNVTVNQNLDQSVTEIPNPNPVRINILRKANNDNEESDDDEEESSDDDEEELHENKTVSRNLKKVQFILDYFFSSIIQFLN